MSRRLRLRLLLVVLILGLPLGIGVVVVMASASGRLASLIEREYTATAKMPGRLQLDGVTLISANTLRLTNARISADGNRPLAQIDTVEVRMDWVNRRMLELRLKGTHMYMDAANFQLLQGIIEAGDATPTPDPVQPYELHADGDVLFASGLRIVGARTDGTISGPLFELTGSGAIASDSSSHPFAVHIGARHRPGSQAGALANRRITVELDHAAAPAIPALDAVTAMGLMPRVPDVLRPWLPGVITVDGSVVHRDLGALHFTVPAHITWSDPAGRPGLITADLDADRNRITVTVPELNDPALGRALAGTVVVDLRRNTVVFTTARFVPGPGLGLPAAVPVEALLREVPRLRVEHTLEDHATTVELTAPERGPRLGLAWKSDNSLAIEAEELPLTLAQGFMPIGVAIGGGQAQRFTADFIPGPGLAGGDLRRLDLRVGQGRATWKGWSVGPVDGTLAYVPGAVPRLDVVLPVGTCTVTGLGAAGHGSLRVPAIDGLLTRIHGPVTLPRIAGSLELDLGWTAQPDKPTILTIERAQIVGGELRFAERDLLQAVRTTLKGSVTLTSGATPMPQVQGTVGGQLSSGQLRLPGMWLDLATRTPIFTVALSIDPASGDVPARLTVREMLVRGAAPAGEPRAEDYSAQFTAVVDDRGQGRIDGVIDRVDLAWANRQARLPPGAMAGFGAVTATATMVGGEITRVDGHALPLNVDVQLGTRFRAAGITGAVDFTIDRASGDGK